MAKKVEEYLEYSHEKDWQFQLTEPPFPTREYDLEQAEKNKTEAERIQRQLYNGTAVRNGLEEEEIDDFLWENYKDKESCEYLVDGAILTCTNCTRHEVYIKDEMASSDMISVEKVYKATLDPSIDDSMFPDNDIKVFGRLNVTENLTANSNGLMHATIKDCIKNNNIPSFGNCLRAPDSNLEKSVFFEAWSEEKKGIKSEVTGTCQYLMRLESEWENYEIGQKFQSFDDDVHGNKTGITMTSILFCKHGGFIYPVTSGQTQTYLKKENPKSMSKEGKYALMYWEILSKYSLSMGYLVLSPEGDKLLAIKPHMVGDRSITLGIGDYITPDDLDFYADRNIELHLPAQYDEVDKNGKPCCYKEETINNAYNKIKDKEIPIEICIEKYKKDLNDAEININNFLVKLSGVSISQRQYDALVIMRYQLGHLNELTDLIKNSDWNKSTWENTLNTMRGNKQPERTEWEMKIMFGTGKYPLEINNQQFALDGVEVEGLD